MRTKANRYSDLYSGDCGSDLRLRLPLHVMFRVTSCKLLGSSSGGTLLLVRKVSRAAADSDSREETRWERTLGCAITLPEKMS